MRKRLILFLVAGALFLGALTFGVYRLFFRVNSVEVLVLMYHDIREEPVEGNLSIISTATFRGHIEALYNAGFQAVNFDDLIAFVDRGRRLPERAVVITFDDGYRSNLEIAAPILEEFGMQATICVIGVSRGRDTHIRSGLPIIPHFTFDEARPWVEAGIIQIQHHSFDMHDVSHHETPETYRPRGASQREGESDAAFRQAFMEDFNILRDMIESSLGTRVTTYAYPYGHYTAATEAMLQELGVRVTLTIHPGTNVIWRGMPESLFLLNRLDMTEAIPPSDVAAYLEYFLIGQG
ncbi:MAG: polysaccharide deacetylase family protein [Oscillospiraceae bacterium]|nr:polysaccharide deacetylase family protein [Oscillospiraceae bacterium]